MAFLRSLKQFQTSYPGDSRPPSASLFGRALPPVFAAVDDRSGEKTPTVRIIVQYWEKWTGFRDKRDARRWSTISIARKAALSSSRNSSSAKCFAS